MASIQEEADFSSPSAAARHVFAQTGVPEITSAGSKKNPEKRVSHTPLKYQTDFPAEKTAFPCRTVEKSELLTRFPQKY